ncbi:uncharacterized protein LOC135839155 [Planococcus citri]|uniref:uncharacterized protein LOC135839155 n=1 Tax=Planococcus citri TaxID=170843 RepID=UPI0031F86CA2
MDWRANVMWIYAIGVVLIITNAEASEISGDKLDNSSSRVLMTDEAACSSSCCGTMRRRCQMGNVVRTAGYDYRHFFPIKEINGEIKVKFKVRADRDAHMLFSDKIFPQPGDTYYEINLGGRGNTVTVIRRNKDFAVERSVEEPTPNVVHPWDYREFWVTISHYGAVRLGRKGENAFIQFKYRYVVPINYYSVSAWETSALWKLPLFSYE